MVLFPKDMLNPVGTRRNDRTGQLLGRSDRKRGLTAPSCRRLPGIVWSLCNPPVSRNCDQHIPFSRHYTTWAHQIVHKSHLGQHPLGDRQRNDTAEHPGNIQ